MGEAPWLWRLLRSVTQGMLVMWDRGLHFLSDGSWQSINKQAAILEESLLMSNLKSRTAYSDVGLTWSYVHLRYGGKEKAISADFNE